MRSNFWVTLVGLILLLSAFLQQPALFLLGLLLSLVAGASRVWRDACLAEVTYQRRFGAKRLEFGEETDLVIEIVNRKPLPLAWLKVEDEFPEELELLTGRLQASSMPHRAYLTNVLALRWYERVRRRYRLRASQRGVFTFGPARVRSGDIFGFIVREEEMGGTDEIVVYPKVLPLEQLGLPAERPLGEARALRRLMEDPLYLMGVRDYAPGDGFRHIHWKATARTGQLQTKVYDPTATLSVLVFLNVETAEMAYYGIDAEVFEFAVSATASIAGYALEAGYPVGLYVNTAIGNSLQAVRLPPDRSPERWTDILETLARITYVRLLRFDDMLRTEAPRLLYGATIIAITAVVTAEIAEALLELRRAGHPVALFVVSDRARVPELPGVHIAMLGGGDHWRWLRALDLSPRSMPVPQTADGLL